VDIVDAHHHLINSTELVYPWIDTRQPVLTALLSNYYDAAHEYLPEHYRSEVDEARFTASVACEIGASDGMAEAAWVQHCANNFGSPDAFIAAIQLDSDDVADVLAQYRELPIVRAVRQPLYWAADPGKRLGARGDYLTDPAWLHGFEQVAATELVWDLLVYDEQLPETHDLISSFPDTTFVVEAIGWPLDRSEDGFARWEERLRGVSEFPNVVLKMQGIALILGTSEAAIGPWIRMALNIFGANRCMFASHYPVDHLLWDCRTMVRTIEATIADLPADEHAEFFGLTARRVYRLN